MRGIGFGLAVLLAGWAAGTSSGAVAQQRITLPSDQPYRHKPSGLSVPMAIDGLTRTEATILAPELDEYVNFASPKGGEALTIYIYRLVAGSVPVWFDRTSWAVEHRDLYTQLQPTGPAVAFTPPGQTTASGLMRVYATGGEFRSTGTAMLPLGGEWIVNIRYSSKTLDAAALQQHLATVLAAIGWPNKIAPQPTAAPVVDCSTALALTGEAKPIQAKTEDALAASLIAAAASLPDADKKKGRIEGPPVVWCRDATPVPGMETSAIYRANGTPGAYLLAFNDAGRGLSAGPNEIGALIGKGPASWIVQLHDTAQTLSYAPVDRLPPPGQALQMLRQAPMATVTTWGKKRDIAVDGGLMK